MKGYLPMSNNDWFRKQDFFSVRFLRDKRVLSILRSKGFIHAGLKARAMREESSQQPMTESDAQEYLIASMLGK